MRIVVVGGGIYGVTAALELRQRGHSVLMVEPGPVPHPHAATTDISKLIRPDYGSDELYCRMAEESLAGWRRWNEMQSGEAGGPGRPLFHGDGVLILRRGPLEPGSFERTTLDVLRRRGHNPRELGKEDIRQLFPAWNADVFTHGYVHRSGGWAESGHVLRWLHARAVRAGVDVVYRRATGLEPSGAGTGGWVVRLQSSGTGGPDSVTADRVLVAAGAWTPALVPELRPLMRAVGQIVFHFRVPPHLIPLFQPPLFLGYAADIQRTGMYGFPVHPVERGPDGCGILKVGHHGAGYPLAPDGGGPSEAEILARLEAGLPEAERRARQYLETSWPAMRGAEVIYRRMCLYCDTVDTDFAIGSVPGRAGLFVSSGGSGHGFKFAPILGTLAADAVEGRPCPYGDRFALRADRRQRANTNDGDAARMVPNPSVQISRL